jgi:nucleoside-diphosphate-sugar epimerase
VRILLTGATGFIGSRLLPELADRHETFAITRRSATRPFDGTEWVVHDLAYPLTASRLPSEIDAVIHLAQSRQYRDFPQAASDVFAVNVQSTFHLLEYARGAGARAFLYASSGGVYLPSAQPLSECDPTEPTSFYLSSKCAAEALVSGYRSILTTVILRFFFVYGPGQRGMLVPSLLERILTGGTVIVEGNPGRRVNPIYVGDAIRAFEPALELQASDVLNVAGDDPVTIDGLVRAIEHATRVSAHVEHVPAHINGDLVGDNKRMKTLLGVTPKTSLSEGIAKVAEHALSVQRGPT